MSDSIKTIDIHVNPSYQVHIGSGLLSRCGSYLLDAVGMCHLAVVVDSTVAPLYLDTVTDSLRDAGYPVSTYIYPAGEAHKNLDTLADILEFLAAEHLTRSDCVVALGGGVCGDMAGFAAGCYLRGIRYVQLPTTLLSAVDSSVGGKTAVNLDTVKNIVGAFWQPRLVAADTDTLSTLPARQVSNGLAEALKMAATFDEELFSLFESGKAAEKLEEVCARSVDLKRAVVEKDEREGGLRKLLNFGHTIGHGIESACGMSGMLHGECVAVGMLPMCSPEVSIRIGTCLEKLSLPTRVNTDPARVLEAVKHDKKAHNDRVSAVFVDEIGKGYIKDITFEELEERIKLVCE